MEIRNLAVHLRNYSSIDEGEYNNISALSFVTKKGERNMMFSFYLNTPNKKCVIVAGHQPMLGTGNTLIDLMLKSGQTVGHTHY